MVNNKKYNDVSTIHTVLFDKKMYPWGEIRVMKWLVKHDLIPEKFDISDERIRARIIDPEELYKLNAKFRTIDIDEEKGIKYIIAYIPRKNKNKLELLTNHIYNY
jgi:hypothetical protein